MQAIQGAVFLLLLFLSITLLWLAVRAKRNGKRRAFRGLVVGFVVAAAYPFFSVAGIYSAPDPRECFHRVVGFHPGPEYSGILVKEEKGWTGGYRAFIKFNAGPDTRLHTIHGLRISQAPRENWQEYVPAEVPNWWSLPFGAPTFQTYYSVERLPVGNGNFKPGKVVFFGYDTATGESFVYMDEP